MEVLHKASLVHDDIEDGDALRYGQPTLHQRHGVPLAINAGDHLIGLGYRLIATQADAVGARCAAELCALLAEAHLRLCRGQAAELLWWRGRAGRTARPIDLLAVYAHKTAPAFEASLASGLRLADASPPERFLRAYCRAIGVAYQILDDLAEWRMPEGAGADAEEAGPAGRDLLAGRPTLLHALAMEHAGSGQARRLEAARGGEEGAAPAERLNEARRLYAETGAFDRARRLVEKYRARAAGLTRELEGAAVRRLLQALADLVLAPDG
jgi:geranylgeranyl pyrophosphate synthase